MSAAEGGGAMGAAQSRLAGAGQRPRALGGPPRRNDDEQLRRMSHELEGLFLRRLFQAMRESVPQSGLTGDSSGEEMFQSLLDDRLASDAASRMRNGIGEALYHQISSRLKKQSDPPKP